MKDVGLASFVSEELAKKAPETWTTEYAAGYNQALTDVLEWIAGDPPINTES